MEETYGCNLINTKCDGRHLKEFVGKELIHFTTGRPRHLADVEHDSARRVLG